MKQFYRKKYVEMKISGLVFGGFNFFTSLVNASLINGSK